MRKVLLLVFLAVLTACGDSTGPSGTHAGVYSLQTVNGQGLPYTIFSFGADRIEVVSERLTVNADGTWSSSAQLRTVEGGQTTTETLTDVGTYQLRGNNVTFVYSDGSTGAGSYSNGVFTVSTEGFTLIYRK